MLSSLQEFFTLLMGKGVKTPGIQSLALPVTTVSFYFYYLSGFHFNELTICPLPPRTSGKYTQRHAWNSANKDLLKKESGIHSKMNSKLQFLFWEKNYNL